VALLPLVRRRIDGARSADFVSARSTLLSPICPGTGSLFGLLKNSARVRSDTEQPSHSVNIGGADLNAAKQGDLYGVVTEATDIYIDKLIDPRLRIYYYATDFIVPWKYSTDVAQGSNLAPIDIGAKGIAQ
jgi:hypothetical protein